jgi:uncharacterized membrane protein
MWDTTVNKSRIETFSDGVFAIAITLLVLTIEPPSDYGHLGRQLTDRWPALAAYVVSFAVIGIMWLNHHTVLQMLGRVDKGLFYLNLLLLMTVVILPYPTEVLGEALRLGEGERTAAIAYSAVMAVNAYSWSALWVHASRNGRLLHPDALQPDGQPPPSTGFLLGSLLYTASVGVAVLNAFACLGFHAALAIWYALDPLSRQRTG